MAQQVAAAAGNGDGENGGNDAMGSIFRGLIIWFVFSAFLKKGGAPSDGSGGEGPGDVAGDVAGDATGEQGAGDPNELQKPPFASMFALGQAINLRVYLSPSDEAFATDDLVWEEEGIYFDWQESNARSKNITLPLTGQWSDLQRNGSVYAHVYFYVPSLHGSIGTLRAKHHRGMAYRVHQLNRYAERPKVKIRTNLLGYGDGGSGSGGGDTALVTPAAPEPAGMSLHQMRFGRVLAR